MAAAAPSRSRFLHDALTLSLFAAACMHALIILGVTFDIDLRRPLAPERTLDVTLVRPTVKQDTPKDPEFLSQISQQGGAELVTEERPTPAASPKRAQVPNPRPLPVQERQPAGAQKPSPRTEKKVVVAEAAEKKVRQKPNKPTVKEQPRPTVAQLLASTQQEINRITAELDKRSLNKSRHERRKSVNASTQEYKYAAYLEAWRKKVERIGNLNYPEEAKRKKLYGALLLHVAVRADGSVELVRVVRSSGHKILDDAAVRIVKRAAPFSPFPPEIREEVDALDITRTWQFLTGNRLFSE